MREFIFQLVLFLMLIFSPIFAKVACPQSIAYRLDSQIWGMDVNTKQKFILINPHRVERESDNSPSWSRDGKTIAVVIDGNIWIVDFSSRKRRRLIRANQLHFIGTPAWSQDGNFLYVGRCKKGDTSSDEGLWKINVRNGKTKRLIQPEDSDFPIHEYPIVSADGHYLISSEMMDGKSSFYAIDLRSNKSKKLPKKQIFKFVMCYIFNKSNKMLFLGGDAYDEPFGKGPGGVWRWNLTTNTCSPWILKGETIDEISISPNGKTIIICISRIKYGEGIHLSYYAYSQSGTQLTNI